MADNAEETPEDPWLTLAEIAEELRMSPATIRSWVSSGALRATRPGKRKLLVRRSELDRMLRGEDMSQPDSPPGAETWRTMDLINPPGRSPHWPPEAVEHVMRGGWLGVAETQWRDALKASRMAPPDAAFLVRLTDIAEAAARKAAALANLGDADPRDWWHRQSGLPSGLSYELRPGAVRPGPPELWTRFDQIVEQLSAAMEEHSAPDELRALEQLSLILHEIVDSFYEEEERRQQNAPFLAEGKESVDEDSENDDSGADQSVS